MHILFFLILCVQCNGQIINEISPYPKVGVPEWIELHNNTMNTIQLLGVTIEDNSTKQVIPDIVIPVNSYIILTKDTLALQRVFPHEHVYSFIQTSLPVLNNTKDKLLIIANKGTFRDSIFYAFHKANRGKTLERKIATNYDTLLISTNPVGHTAGFINSCLPMSNDARINDLYQHIDSITVHVENNGDSTLHYLNLSIKSDSITVNYSIDSLKSFTKDSIIIDIRELSVNHGINPILVYIQHQKRDPRSYNDTMSTIVYRSFPYGTIRINEINIRNTFYPEYVELIVTDSIYQDRTPLELIINNDTLCIDDSILKEYNVISSKSLNMYDSSALYINEAGLRINDQAGEILLRDRNGSLLDSVNYGPIITEYSTYSECSIEYSVNVDKQWFISTDKSGGTPGKKNSPINRSQSTDLHIHPNCHEFEIDCKNYTIKHPFYIGSYSCDVFSTSGLYIKNIIQELLLPSEGQIHIPEDAELYDQIVILLHTVKDLHGTSILHVLTPILMRN